jgi:hypothetical protein
MIVFDFKLFHLDFMLWKEPFINYGDLGWEKDQNILYVWSGCWLLTIEAS